MIKPALLVAMLSISAATAADARCGSAVGGGIFTGYGWQECAAAAEAEREAERARRDAEEARRQADDARRDAERQRWDSMHRSDPW